MATVEKFRPYNADRFSLNGVATGTGTAISFHDCRQVSWEIRVEGTASSGGPVVIETNDIAFDYPGVWHELDSVDPVTLTGDDVYHGNYPGPVGWVRGRLPASVAGGAVVYIPLNGLLG